MLLVDCLLLSVKDMLGCCTVK